MRSIDGITILAVLLCLMYSAHARLLGCIDVGCPAAGPYCSCSLGNQTLTSIGVSTLTNTLLKGSLSWTVGFDPGLSAAQGGSLIPDSRNYYLGQPPFSHLQNSTSVKACALFFNGISPGLSFNTSEAKVGILRANGICEDAMPALCALDLKTQAQNMAMHTSNDDFTCQSLADRLRSNIPASCTASRRTWGTISAYPISGPEMPAPLAIGSCNPSINGTYSVTKIHSTESTTTSDETFKEITPVLTVVKSTNTTGILGVDANLNCLKPVLNEQMFNSAFEGGASHILAHTPRLSLSIGAIAVALLL